jgi:hypothetical protein
LPAAPSKAFACDADQEATPALPAAPSKAFACDADQRGHAGFAGVAV